MTSSNLTSHVYKTRTFVMAILHWKQGLLCDKYLYVFPSYFLLSHKTIIETMVRSESKDKSYRNDYHQLSIRNSPSRGSNQRLFVHRSCFELPGWQKKLKEIRTQVKITMADTRQYHLGLFYI